GDADPHHELPDFVLAALLALGGAVAIVALIGAVEFEQAVAAVVERHRGIGEVARDGAAQLPALLLDGLGLRDVVDGVYRRAHFRPHPARPLAVKARPVTSGGATGGAKVRLSSLSAPSAAATAVKSEASPLHWR